MSYAIKAGDLGPPLELVLTQQDGQPLDLTGYRVWVSVASRPGAEPIAQGWATVHEPETGRALYYWTQGETDRAGTYLVECVLTDENGDETSVPGAGYAIITIGRRLA